MDGPQSPTSPGSKANAGLLAEVQKPPSKSASGDSIGDGMHIRPWYVFLAFCLYATMAVLGLCLIFVTVTGTTKWGREKIWDRYIDELEVKANFYKSSRTGQRETIVFGYIIKDMLNYWGVPFVMILCALAVFAIPERHVVLGWMKPLATVLGREPRWGWLQSWCGGINVGELIFIGVFLLRNALCVEWIVDFVDDRLEQRKSALAPGESLPHDDQFYYLEGVGLSLGVACFQNLMWLFFPITRVSPLFEAMGLSFEKRIRYHRWLGHWTMWVLTIHGALYWIVWVRESGAFWKEEALDWPEGIGVNNLAGAISLGFGLVLWVTALEWTRRKYFEVFYRTHIVGFLGFIVFGILHSPGMHIYLSAGLLLYCLDLVLRLTQMSTPVEVKWSAVTSDRTISVLGIDNAKPLCPLSTFFVSVKNISMAQWHPVTPVSIYDGSGMKVCFKQYGKWTKDLVRKAGEGLVPSIKIDGPYHATPDICKIQEHEWVVAIAGGIAITPLLTILKELAACSQSFFVDDSVGHMDSKGDKHVKKADSGDDSSSGGQVTSATRGILVVWSMRSIAEAELMDEELFQYSREHPDILDLRIHYTGKDDISKWTGQMILNEDGEAKGYASSGKGKQRSGWLELGGWINRLSPQALPLHLGKMHLALLHTVMYGGGLMGYILARAYGLEISRASVLVYRGKVDVVSIFSIFMMAIGMMMLFVFPAHLFMYAKAKRGGKDDNLETGTLGAKVPRLSPTTVEWIKQNKRAGRPDLEGLLDDISGKLHPGRTAAVITAGPQKMIDIVKLACAKRNPLFHLQQPLQFEMEAFEL